jgi:4-hydroxybenzoate polyprenyltransferase
VGAQHARPLSARRPRWRSYLLLARVSNLPTVWTNVLAGMVTAAPLVEWPVYLRVALAASLFYTGGMFLNDAFDEAFDRRSRPERPLPAGDVSRGEVLGVGCGLLAAGEALLLSHPYAALLGLVLAAAIVFYDYRHKGSSVAPIVMGACRGLVYGIAGTSAGIASATIAVGGAVMTTYVAGLTVVAKMAGARARWLVPMLIAGIALVDAAWIATIAGRLDLALIAASGFPATLALQRAIPGD